MKAVEDETEVEMVTELRGNYGLFFKNIYAVLKPGEVVPSLREVIDILPNYNFYTLDVESLRRHYNRTLLCWLENFRKHKADIAEKMGTEFSRMWELYLAACAATFHNGVINLHQILMSKGINNNLPMTRIV